MNKAIYPGSFDPTTNGHLDIISRAAKCVDQLIVAVLNNSSKKPLFTVEERVCQLKELTKNIQNVQVLYFSGLLVDFAKQLNANVIIRGLRAVTDFEYEFQMAITNRTVDKNIETLFIPTSTQCLYLSSSTVKEMAMLGNDINYIKAMVPELIKIELQKKMEIIKNRGDC